MTPEHRKAIADDIARRLQEHQYEHGNEGKPFLDDIESLSDSPGVVAMHYDGEDMFMEVQEA